ncbi:hypothetical protein [uncultured Mediterranean phage uvMED]|nr:hypothetical protein [uncultured Mediterranean phage uvMED]
MSVISKFCKDKFKVYTDSENYFSEITLYVNSFLNENFFNFYEDENHILFGVECENKAYFKVYKVSCSCGQFYKIEAGDFTDEIPEGTTNVFNETVFNKIIF